MGFVQFIPCDALKPYVEHLAISENTDEATYKVLPQTGLVIGFQFKGKLYKVVAGREIELSRSGITGINDSYQLFRNSNNIGTVLVYFKPGGASQFFRQPLHELFQTSLSLDNFLLRSELMLLEEQLCEATSDVSRIKIVEKFLVARMTSTEHDVLVIRALDIIFQKNGNVRINELIEKLHTSQSPLEKRFRKVVGTSPKKFASIVRLQSIIAHTASASNLKALGYDAGFYDQSHFIKEFKKFTGQTPEDYNGDK